VSRRATSFPLPLLQISADCPQPAPYWVVGPVRALSSLELYFRNISSLLGHTAGMKKASLQFHIKKNDFFGTVATVLDLLRQDLDRRGYKPHAGTLSRLRDDLVYLQHSHRIEKIGSRERDSQPAIGSGLASFS